jgi:hypothetical protein
MSFEPVTVIPLLIQGGHDLLAAVAHDGKAMYTLQSTLSSAQLTNSQETCARALYVVDGLGPKHAVAIARAFPGIGALMDMFAKEPKAEACHKIANLTRDGGRCVGPVVANRLHWFLTCEDPSAAVD